MNKLSITHPNPLSDTRGLPLFDQIKEGHVVPAVRQLLQEVGQDFQKVEDSIREDSNSKDFPHVLENLNQIEYRLSRVWGTVNHLLGVKNTSELREAHEEVQKEVVDFCLRMGQSKALYCFFQKAEQELQKCSDSSPEFKRMLALRLRDAKHAGVGLPSDKRKRFNEIAAELSKLGHDFTNRVLDVTKAFSMIVDQPKDIEGIPLSCLQLAADNYLRLQENSGTSSGFDSPEESTKVSRVDSSQGPWCFTLEAPLLVPFLENCRNRSLREKIYRAFIGRASEGELSNQEAIRQILCLRKEQAKLLGYESYAEMKLESRMAGSVQEVYDFIENLRNASFEPACRELDELREFARSEGESNELCHWDISFWAERLREKKFHFIEEDLRPYFPFSKVLEGLFCLAGNLFNIQISSAEKGVAVWHPDVRFFHIKDKESGQKIASFYLDPYSRPQDKRGGAWMDECINRWQREEDLQLPVAYLICNAAPPLGDQPALMNFREVETLFHEFGHGLQHMLTKVKYPDISGINGVEWDAVEFPSQFMENWCYHRPTLLSLSSHLETKEPLPDDLLEQIREARNYRSASTMLRQLRFSLLDMELHHSFDPFSKDTSVFDIQKGLDPLTSPLPSLPEDYFLCSFMHIFGGGYSAGYYSYKWAEVLSADAFSAFEEVFMKEACTKEVSTKESEKWIDSQDPSIQKVGLKFRDTILSLGGSQHPLEVFQSFRGRKPSTSSLLRHNNLAA